MAEPVVTNAEGIARLTLKAGVTAKVGDLIGHDGTDWVLADADGRIPATFMAMQYGVGEAISVCRGGVLFDSDAPYTAGADQSATAGAHTPTIPAASATLTVLQRVGKALTTDTMAFDLGKPKPIIMRATASVDPANLTGNSVANTAVTVTGAAANDVVTAIPPNDLEGDLALQSAVATADTVTLRLHNIDDTNAIDGAAKTWTFVVNRN